MLFTRADTLAASPTALTTPDPPIRKRHHAASAPDSRPRGSRSLSANQQGSAYAAARYVPATSRPTRLEKKGRDIEIAKE